MLKQKELKLAKNYFEEGEVLNEQANYQEALMLFEKAIVFYKKWEEWEEWIEVGNKIGLIYKYIGKYEEGIAFLQNILKVAEQYFGKDSYPTASSISNIGENYFQFGEYKIALKYYQKALTLRKKKYGDEKNPNLAINYKNIGICYIVESDYDLGLIHLQEALNLRRKSHGEEDFLTAEILANLGAGFCIKGMYDTAIRYAEEALEIKEKIYEADHPVMCLSLNVIGSAYWRTGDYAKAITYQTKSLNIRKKILGANHPDVAFSLEGIGICYHDTKDFDLGIQYLQQAIDIATSHHGKYSAKLAALYLNIGNCYVGKKDYKQALNYFQKGLIGLVANFQDSNIYQNPKNVQYTNPSTLSLVYAEKCNNFLKLYKEQSQNPKDLLAALSTAITASDFITDLRTQHKTEGAKQTLAEKALHNYDIAIKIALETYTLYQTLPTIPQCPEFTNIPLTAIDVKNLTFNFSEQCKAILLLSSIKDSEAKGTVQIPTQLLEQEEALQLELSKLNNNIVQQTSEGEDKDEVLLSQLQSEYFYQKQAYDQLIEQFEADYPEYYQLKYSISTVSVQDLQYYLSPRINSWATNRTNSSFEGGKGDVNTNSENNTTIKQSAILSYHIAEETIYIFAISSNDYQITMVEKPTDFSHLVEKLQGDIQLGSVNEFIQSSTQLFDVLLQPVWDFLQETSKLIIIPHGELYYVPFDVLLNQHQITDAKNFSDLPYLIRDFDISYHYSATLLLHNHQRQLQTSEQIDSFFGLAPVHFGGEEVSEKKEGYVVKSSGKQDNSRRRILKSSGNAQEALEDLEETELEVKEVYQLFEQQGKEAIALFYDQANKQNLQEYIGGYKYVLISTHGFLHEVGKNTLSGIHLAPQKSGERSHVSAEKGEGAIQQFSNETVEDNDYILHASETYHLNLNADLVVLSSCESGVGELKVGEGMMALNRGFLYAGASNIVYSLFQVPQDSTSQLTQALFRYILEGENYAAALRKAKLGLIADETMEPMDWAGFALVGV